MAELSLDKVMTKLPRPSLSHVKRALKDAQYMLPRAGVTSCPEPSANSLNLHGLHEHEGAGDLETQYAQSHRLCTRVYW
jgi:hypothetical protein